MDAIVLDTNVLVSGFLSPDGPPGIILDWLRAGQLTLVLDDRIFQEYEQVLTRPKFKLPTKEISTALEFIQTTSLWAEIGPHHHVSLRDHDDEPFAECALATNALLITGNVAHFPKLATKRIRIMTPRQFVTLKQSPQAL